MILLEIFLNPPPPPNAEISSAIPSPGGPAHRETNPLPKSNDHHESLLRRILDEHAAYPLLDSIFRLHNEQAATVDSDNNVLDQAEHDRLASEIRHVGAQLLTAPIDPTGPTRKSKGSLETNGEKREKLGMHHRC